MSALNFSKNKAPKEPTPPKEKKKKKEKKSDDIAGLDQFGSAVASKGKKGKTKKVKAPAKKVPADTYTFILLIAWLALVAACIFLYLDISSYK